MGLLANGFRDNLGAFKTFGATVSNNAYPGASPKRMHGTAAMRNLIAGQGVTDDKAGYPSGYRHPSCWMLPQKAGALASRNLISGAGDIEDLNLAGGVNGEATLAGVGDLTGTGALIVSLVAALTGSGTISNADAIAYLNLAAELAGSGDLAGAATALGHAAAALTGDGDLAGLATALGELEASIVVTGDVLNSANVASAVWGALAAAFNDPGTMGEKLNDAGSAANPWTEEIETGYTAEELMRLISAVLLGESSGGGGATRTFRDVNDTTDRVVASVETDGDRTTVTLDPS